MGKGKGKEVDDIGELELIAQLGLATSHYASGACLELSRLLYIPAWKPALIRLESLLSLIAPLFSQPSIQFLA